MQMLNNFEISIIIVNFKTPELTDICIGSILKYTRDLLYEIIIVDNFSQDGSEQRIMSKYPEVDWINMTENAGTTRAWNTGIRYSNGNYILILNSDTEFIDNAIYSALQKYKELELKAKIGLLGCQLKGYDEVIQYNSNLQFPSINKYLKANPFCIWFNRKHTATELNDKLKRHQTEHETKWIGLAFGLFNAEICKKQGIYFDEDIFMYSDEVEWCHRLIKEGYHHYFSPCATILHLNSGSSSSSEWRNGQIIISEWLCIMKTYGRFYLLRCFMQIFFNHLLDNMLYLKQRIKGKISEDDQISSKQRQFVKKLLKKYFWIILFNYKPRPSSGKNFLKYNVKKNKREKIC